MKKIKSPNKTIREIITAVLVFIIAFGVGITAGIKNNYRWIGLGIVAACIFAIIGIWVSYKVLNKRIKSYVAEQKQLDKEEKESQEEQKEKNQKQEFVDGEFHLTKNFSWVFDVPELEGSSLQFATDASLKTAIECCDQARNDINYMSNFEKYKDIELNNINIYIRKVLEWALKFVKLNDKRLKKWKTFYTIFDGKKIVYETDFVIDKPTIECKWELTKFENDVYTYCCKFMSKTFYQNSFKKYTGNQLINVWKLDEVTGTPFIKKWAKAYAGDHKMQIIEDVCLDIYKTTSKVIHSSEDTRKITNMVYAKYYKDLDVSDKAKALLLAKVMFHQVRFVLWYVAYKYSGYKVDFAPTISSFYKAK